MVIEITHEHEMRQYGEKIGRLLKGGEVIELVGDVGAGKTTFTKGIARGLGIDDEIQSPTFTISRQYPARDGLMLAHYDFYRIAEPGIMADELHESIGDNRIVTVVEWSDVVRGVLPDDRITIYISSPDINTRQLTLKGINSL